MADDAQKGIFYLEESNGNHETLLTFNVPRRHSAGDERTRLRENRHKVFKSNVTPDLTKLDFIMKEDDGKSESFDDFSHISKQLEYQNNCRCFPSAVSSTISPHIKVTMTRKYNLSNFNNIK